MAIKTKFAKKITIIVSRKKQEHRIYMQDISGNDSCDKLNFWLRNNV